MQQRTRHLIVWGLLLALMAVGACGGRSRPPIVTPPTPTCDGGTFSPAQTSPTTALRTAHGTYLSVERGGGYPSCGVTADRAEAGLWETFGVVRVTATQVGLRSSSGFLLSVDAAGKLAANRPYETPQAWETFTAIREGAGVALRTHLGTYLTAEIDGTLRVTAVEIGPWEIFTPSDPSAIVGVVHPDPVVGAIRVRGDGECFADDTGCRLFTIIHAGDSPLRWHAGGEAQVLADLDDMAAAGFHIIRMWSDMREDGGVWSRGGDPPYPGLDAIHRTDYVEKQAALLQAIAARGMRATLESGGIATIGSADERQIMQRFREAADRAGHWTVAWVAPFNEPASTHATSDDNGDNEPGYLYELAQIVVRGTSMLWHLGGVSNTEWNTGNRFSQKRYTHRDMAFGYVHASRAGEVHDKIRHRFSWQCVDCDLGGDRPAAFKRLWVDGEGTGVPVCGGSLRCVSATSRGDQLDAEALSLLVAVQSLRGIGNSMSGNGVQRHHPFPDVVGFAQIPWTVRQLPDDLHTFRTHVHGGRANAVFRAVQRGDQVLRVDQSIADDGRIVGVAYSTHREQSWSVPVTRDVRVRVCDTGATSCTAYFDVPAGGAIPLGQIRWGRVLEGRIR